MRSKTLMMLSVMAVTMSACGAPDSGDAIESIELAGEEGDASSSPESMDENEAGQIEQEAVIGAGCGHGTFAFAECLKLAGNKPDVARYGCKARSSGEVVRERFRQCSRRCVDHGVRVQCD